MWATNCGYRTEIVSVVIAAHLSVNSSSSSAYIIALNSCSRCGLSSFSIWCLVSHNHRHKACSRWKKHSSTWAFDHTECRAFLRAAQSSVRNTCGPSDGASRLKNASAPMRPFRRVKAAVRVDSDSLEVMPTPWGRAPHGLCVRKRNTRQSCLSMLPDESTNTCSWLNCHVACTRCISGVHRAMMVCPSGVIAIVVHIPSVLSLYSASLVFNDSNPYCPPMSP